MPDFRKVSSRGAALLGVGVLMAWGVTPAPATVVDRGTFADSEIGVADEICGIDVIRDSSFSLRSRLRLNKASDGQAFMQRLNFQYLDTFTNPLNGKSMSFEGRVLESEVKATHVEGTVYEFTIIEAGHPFTVRDSSGNVVLRESGVIRSLGLFDTLGDGTPGGLELDHDIISVGGPHPGLDQSEEEFCAMVEGLLLD
jgi:hypothetical protein